jgi:hypothetical protein
MGMFDTVRCEYPLPYARHQDLEYQTKDLECLLVHYTITRDGRLVLNARQGRGRPSRDIEWPLHGDIRIYTSDDSVEPHVWIEYVVRFTHGRVEWIRPKEEVPPTPEVPAEELDWDWSWLENLSKLRKAQAEAAAAASEIQTGSSAGETALKPEEALLANLRRERENLKKLLTKNNDHWGYEDPVYRFYHQSFKVYYLQQQTRSIVQKLQALAPDRPLNPWFVQIVEAGTGKEFKHEDNARWTEVTRPILEAFFHARFFLEMAVRYADLEAPPQPLPSGYAALLCLFGLR